MVKKDSIKIYLNSYRELTTKLRELEKEAEALTYIKASNYEERIKTNPGNPIENIVIKREKQRKRIEKHRLKCIKRLNDLMGFIQLLDNPEEELILILYYLRFKENKEIAKDKDFNISIRTLYNMKKEAIKKLETIAESSRKDNIKE